MRSDLIAVLDPTDIDKLASSYLNGGRKQESWRIDAVEIAGASLNAQVSMRSTYVSATNAKGFHLTIFSTLEFLSQLMIVYAHVWAGLEEKVREGWMVESSTRSLRAIRSAVGIRVEMRVRSMRRRGEHLYCVADYRVTDDGDGLFEATLKGFLS